MKAGKQGAATVIALAILGFGQLGLAADDVANQFTPLEKLAPVDRVAVQKYVDENGFKIDYENFVLGLDGRGELALAPKSLLDTAKVGEPCSAGRVLFSMPAGN